MIKLTKKADYGLIAMKHLAEHDRQRACSAKELAEAHGIPTELLAKILQRLVRARLLVSHHGINGGYNLARDARTISAFDVIKAIDGPLFLTSCVTHRGECEQTSRCTVREPLRRVSLGIEEVLSKLTIWELTQEAENCPGSGEELVTLSSKS
ncbi:MAG TPA: Rrf2 family transcriptional regulator [Terriglobales bacterium]|nr:Rrf2 family transcriptional regulator [Terriglobales bacterium]